MDLLLAGHGFTKEHAEPRSHAFMLIDHLVVDRAYGGRFQFKNLTYIMNPGKAWDVLEDKGANFTMPETAKAANPVCLQCKSSDNILKWAYMGDKNPKAVFDRTSNVVDVAKSLNNIVGCIQCHDPHSNKPRIVRDALIEAVQRDGVNPYNPDYATKVEVQEFRNFRKIGVLNRPDSNLMCAQCHVEYNCNPGIDLKGNRIGMNDSRTNHFPWKNVFELQKHYDELDFRDFKHAITNASLIKVQHPEAETYWQSAHEKAGVECKNCHMPKMNNKAGKEYTSHWQVSPRNYLNETCLKCHAWTPEQAEYEIDAVQNYVKGKMRKAEFSLTRFIETFEKAKASGVNQSALDEARKYHDTANVLWEWWTAENSDGFHNPEQARESLTKSIEASKKGTALLEGAMAQSKTQTMSQPATTKAAPGFETAAAVMALIALASIVLRKRR